MTSHNVNDKARFVVFTALLLVLWPMTLMAVVATWLMGALGEVCGEYVRFYRSTWREK